MRTILSILAAIALVAVPSAMAVPSQAAAAAFHYLNPPGDSGVNQYTEVVPTSSGSAPTGGLGGEAGPGSGLSAAAARTLKGSRSGAQTLSRFVAATAPPAPARGAAAVGLPPVGGQSPLGSLAQGVGGGGGGMGVALPLIMGASLLVALAFLALRRRTRS